MTTTHIYQGMGDDPRASSRVLRPPGGGSSNIFGGTDDTPPTQVKNYNKSDIFNRDGTEPAKESPVQQKKPTGSAAAPFACGDSSQTETKSAQTPTQKHSSTVNPLAPPPPEPEKPKKNVRASTNPFCMDPEPPKQQPSTRVRQPPGGASSGLW